MRPSPLTALFSPSSIAFIGASDDSSRIGGRPLAYTIREGFDGPIYPVNPSRTTVQGLKAYATLQDIPVSEIDLAVITIPAAGVVDTIRAAATKRVRAAIILSSGFAEMGTEGAQLQTNALEIAAQAGMRLLGPNSLGLFSNRSRVCATFSSLLEDGAIPDGPLAIVSQSGAYGAHLAMLARQRGVGIARFVTTGNEADISVADCIDHLSEDDDVGVIGCYSEGIRDGRALIDAVAKARRAGKPVIMLKVGTSESGRQAAESHTASVAGDDRVFAAVAEEAGIHRVGTTQEFVDLLYTMSRRPPLRGPRLGVITVSGGAGVLIADAVADHQMQLPPLPAAQQDVLRQRIPFGAVVNPVDTTAQAMNDMSVVTDAIRAMTASGAYDAFVGFFMNWPDSVILGPPLRKAISKAIADADDQVMAVCINGGADVVRQFDAAGLLVFDDPTHAVRALHGSWKIGEALRRDRQDHAPVSPATTPLPMVTDEVDALGLLADAGLPMMDFRLVTNSEGAANGAAALGFPVVLKIVSPDIRHKSDVGGVALNLTSTNEVRDAATRMLASISRAVPTAAIRGLLVAPMASGGVELLVGGRVDPVFGPVVVCGLGGVFVEIFEDVAIGLAPLTQEHAVRMLHSLKGWPMLDGARGRKPLDVNAAAVCIVKLSEFVAANSATLDAVEINPLLVREAGHGAIGLDAMIIGKSGTR